MHSARSSAVSFFAILSSFFLTYFSIAILYVRSDYARISFLVMRVVKGYYSFFNHFTNIFMHSIA